MHCINNPIRGQLIHSLNFIRMQIIAHLCLLKSISLYLNPSSTALTNHIISLSCFVLFRKEKQEEGAIKFCISSTTVGQNVESITKWDCHLNFLKKRPMIEVVNHATILSYFCPLCIVSKFQLDRRSKYSEGMDLNV